LTTTGCTLHSLVITNGWECPIITRDLDYSRLHCSIWDLQSWLQNALTGLGFGDQHLISIQLFSHIVKLRRSMSINLMNKDSLIAMDLILSLIAILMAERTLKLSFLKQMTDISWQFQISTLAPESTILIHSIQNCLLQSKKKEITMDALSYTTIEVLSTPTKTEDSCFGILLQEMIFSS
jgi:hypothetical protein